MPDIAPVREVEQIAFRQDNFRRIASLPGIRQALSTFAPSAVADTPDLRYLVLRAQMRTEGDKLADTLFSNVAALGTQERIFGRLDDAGLIREGPLAGQAVNDIRAFPARYSLTPAQRQWVETADAAERAKLDFIVRNGIEANELSFEEGGRYAGRRAYARMTEDGELLEAAFVGPGPGRPGARAAFEKTRIFATQKEAIEAGFRYLPDEEALALNLRAAARRVADKQAADWLLENTSWRTAAAPEALVLAAEQAARTATKAGELSRALNRAWRGERLPTQTLDSLKNVFPNEGRALEAFMEDVQGSLIPARTPAREPLRREALSPQLVSLRQRFRDVASAAAREAKEARRRRAIAAERAQKLRFGETRVQAPAFQGKIFTGPSAQRVARTLNEAFGAPSGVGEAVLRNVNKANDVARIMVLSGDASVFTIQLIFLAGAFPRTFGKTAVAFVQALADPTWTAGYVARNADVVNEARGLLIPGRNRTEFTRALARGGFLQSRLLRPVGKVLEPFARGYESALTVAGVELRKAYRHLATTPQASAELDEFINAFRGLASSERLGVSASVRQLESAAVLAPQYNRAIASLMAMTFKGGLSGTLARRSLAQGIAAVVAAYVAMSLAQGKSPREIAERLNPASSSFLLWDIAGQKIGPGSKVRSLLSVLAQSLRDPRDLASLSMDNPALRFIRGNLAPAPSAGIDLLTGRTYMGDPSRDGLLSFTSNVLAENLLPVWVQSMALEGGTIQQRIARGVAEFFGLRSYPFGIGAVLDEQAPKVFGKRYDRLEPFEKDLLRALLQQRLAPLERRQLERGSELAVYFEKLDAIAQEEAQALVSAAARGESGYEVNGIRNFYRGRRYELGLEREFPPDDVNDSDPNRRALAQHYALYDDPALVYPGTDQIDWGLFDQASARLQATWTPEQAAYVRRNTNTRPVPWVLWQGGGKLLPSTTRAELLLSEAERIKHLAATGHSDLVDLWRAYFGMADFVQSFVQEAQGVRAR